MHVATLWIYYWCALSQNSKIPLVHQPHPQTHIVQDMYLMWLSITDPNSCLSDAIDFSGVVGLYSGVGGFCIFLLVFLIECLQKGKFKDDAMMCSFHRVVLDRLSVHTM